MRISFPLQLCQESSHGLRVRSHSGGWRAELFQDACVISFQSHLLQLLRGQMRISAAFSKQTESFVAEIPTRRLGRLSSVRILGRAELSVVRLCDEGMIQPLEMLLARHSVVGETLAAVVAHVARPTHPYNLKTKNMALERALSRVVGSQVVVEHHHEKERNSKQVHKHGQLHISHHLRNTFLKTI